MEFKQSVIEALKYYVYALVDPRDNKIFYIGKGVGNRVFQHVEDSLNEDAHSLKLDTIREIIKEGLTVKHYILRHRLTEEQAYIVESTLIDLLTYSDFNREHILTNMVAGHHQWDEGIKSSNEINAIYDCSELEVQNGDRLLLVNLNQSYVQKKATGVYVRPNLYEQTRKYWDVNINRAKKADYVLGVFKGIVRGVYKPNKWFAADKADDGTIFKKTRYGFEGVEVLNSPYLNKDATKYPFGSGGVKTYIPRELEYWL